jgi:hypothetical protein
MGGDCLEAAVGGGKEQAGGFLVAVNFWPLSNIVYRRPHLQGEGSLDLTF